MSLKENKNPPIQWIHYRNSLPPETKCSTVKISEFDYRVPTTNNEAERLIRTYKRKTGASRVIPESRKYRLSLSMHELSPTIGLFSSS